MEYRRLGKSGLQVSALSLGSWVTFGTQVDVDGAVDLMACAHDRGVNFFDNAEAYGRGVSERIMGEALKKLGWGRDTFVVSSKVYWGGDKPNQKGLSRKHVHDACHAALERMQVDYLDLFFCHRPDLETPMAETVMVMNDLIRQGKVLYWGTSEWSAEQIREAHGIANCHGLIGPTMEQPQYHLLHRERVEGEYHRLYEDPGLGTTIWSPLASGILTGKYDDGVPDGSRMALAGYEWLREQLESEEGQGKVAKSRELAVVAEELGVSRAQLAIAWCLVNPRVSSVILGASRREQLEENLDALEVVARLDAGILERIETIVDNRPQLPTQF